MANPDRSLSLTRREFIKYLGWGTLAATTVSIPPLLIAWQKLEKLRQEEIRGSAAFGLAVASLAIFQKGAWEKEGLSLSQSISYDLQSSGILIKEKFGEPQKEVSGISGDIKNHLAPLHRDKLEVLRADAFVEKTGPTVHILRYRLTILPKEGSELIRFNSQKADKNPVNWKNEPISEIIKLPDNFIWVNKGSITTKDGEMTKPLIGVGTSKTNKYSITANESGEVVILVEPLPQ